MPMRVKLQSESTALLLGAGYVAKAMIAPLKAQGYRVIATNRTGAPVSGADETLAFHGEVNAEIARAFEGADFILSSIPPRGDPLERVLHLSPKARWIGYLSATSVYGDRGGKWAFEAEAPTPQLARGKARADAELAWIETGWPVHIFRLAGIYGPRRGPFRKLRNGEARAVIKPGHIVNRVYIDDIVSALMASIKKPNPQRIYNLADGHPAPPQDVLNYAADLIKAPRPPEVSLESANISAMARTFYAETKRVDNSRARKELDWSPQYPTYKAGLKAIIKA